MANKINRRGLLIFLILTLGTLALYAPTYFHDFVQYDDNDYVFDNMEVQKGLSVHGLVWAFVDVHVFNYHPLTLLSHMLDCQLFSLQPGPPHLVNALLHSLNAGLLFLFLRSVTGAVWRSALVAALFAWHPMRVESVAWISERKDLLSGFFFILTLWAYACYAMWKTSPTSPSPESRKKLYYRLSLVFFVLGLLAKPMLVMVPIVLFVLDGWPLKRNAVPLWDLLKEKIPFFIASALMSLITFLAQTGAKGAGGALGLHERIGGSLVAYLWYLEKQFWPQDLSMLYLRPAFLPVGLVALAALVLITLSAVAGVVRKKHPYILAGWLWFLVTLLPVIGLIPIGLQLTADRYTYLSCIGLFFAIVWGVFEVGQGLSVIRRVLGIVTIGVLVACALATERQLAYWKNTETLMNHALQVDSHNYVAHLNLGVYYARKGDTEMARIHRERARELLPKQ